LWNGPPRLDLAQWPGELLELCRASDSDTVIVDSLKDAALRLADDDTGSGWNLARQLVAAAGIQIVELHHPRKAQADNKRPTNLEDVYGSRWITSGGGSLIMLSGKAGDPLVEFLHLKPPAMTISPFTVSIDGQAGAVAAVGGMDLREQIALRGSQGITADVAARLLFGQDKPDRSLIEKARYRLNQKADAGLLYCREGNEAEGTPASRPPGFLLNVDRHGEDDGAE
jgi:hypothetical protein